ncbi:MAG: ATP-binding protein, partial [Bacteroidota bacterium]
LYFGGVGGVSFFHPDSISGHLLVPKPAFTDFKIFNRSVHPNQVIIGGKAPLQESISDSVTVNLSHFHNSFTIGFASLDYSNPEDSRYTYRLVGFDSKWNPVDARQRAITYTNLEPDDYVFQVRASNDDGVWNSQPITLFISITPSLLDHTGFKISVVIACALLISFIMFKRVKRSRSHKKFLESENNERTREISEQNELLSQSETYLRNLNKKKDQMFYILTHNVRAPLTTLVGLLKSKTDEDLTDERYNRLLDDLQHQVRDSLLLLDNAFYWSLIQFERIPEKREQVALNGLINQQIHKYNRYASFKNIRINFQCGEELIIDCDQLMTSIIIQNLISNAIKYSHNGGAVNVRFEKGETSSSVVVEDFGIGLTKAEIHSIFNREENVSTHGSQKEKGTGLGLMISQIFAEKMGFRLKVESEKGNYSRFYLDVPHAGGT